MRPMDSILILRKIEEYCARQIDDCTREIIERRRVMSFDTWKDWRVAGDGKNLARKRENYKRIRDAVLYVIEEIRNLRHYNRDTEL